MPFMPRLRPNVKKPGKTKSLDVNNRASIHSSVLSISQSKFHDEKDVVVMKPDQNAVKRKNHRFPRC